MFGLSSVCSSGTRCSCEAAEDRAQRAVGHLVAALDRVRAVHQHLGLDDRDEPALDAQRRVARERVGVGLDAGVARDPVADLDHGPPLREARAEAAVLADPLAQAVEPLGDLLELRRRASGLVPLSTLMPGRMPALLEQLPGRACRPSAFWRIVSSKRITPLMNCSTPGRGEEQLAIGAAVLLRRRRGRCS